MIWNQDTADMSEGSNFGPNLSIGRTTYSSQMHVRGPETVDDRLDLRSTGLEPGESGFERVDARMMMMMMEP